MVYPHNLPSEKQGPNRDIMSQKSRHMYVLPPYPLVSCMGVKTTEWIAAAR